MVLKVGSCLERIYACRGQLGLDCDAKVATTLLIRIPPML